MDIDLQKKGKIIRDAVHGDIFIPNTFLAVVDTPEFQRLRRIKQLSIANMVFPSADHTRFSHSIGTFYIMTQMIKHFKQNFASINIKITEEEENVVLLAALLHDLGHGPFSHAFEGILPEIHNNIKHEEWTRKIIESKDSDVYKAIVENFGSSIPEKVTELISNQKKLKKDGDTYILEEVDLFNVLSSLISSQLDADRMDYLLRDSKQCGVTFGNIDIDRIISSLEITVQDDNYYVCVPEKYVQDIEAYILARYQMQKVVYYHEFKIQMEQLIKKILKRAYKLYNEKKLKNCPQLIETLFSCEISVEDYIKMDDSLFQYAFSVWSYEEDEILKELCNSLTIRGKAKKINALDNSDKYLDMLKEDIIKLFKQYEYNIIELREEYFWIENKPGFSAYKKNKENIWIRQSNGILIDLSHISVIFNNNSEGDVMIWQDNKNIIFINYNILRSLPIKNMNNLIDNLNNIINNYDLRKTVEIEKKYILKSKNTFEKVEKFINNQNIYKVEKKDKKDQVDYYYDTKELFLKKSDFTLRIREKNNNYELTIKRPAPVTSEVRSSQSERFEFKKFVSSKDDLDCNFIKEHLSEINIDDLQPNIIIKNFRIPFILKCNDIKFEMVFDDVKYCNSLEDEGVEDYQIEIELKSDYQHRVNLKLLTDELEKNIKELEISNISKYIRGQELLKEK